MRPAITPRDRGSVWGVRLPCNAQRHAGAAVFNHPIVVNTHCQNKTQLCSMLRMRFDVVHANAQSAIKTTHSQPANSIGWMPPSQPAACNKISCSKAIHQLPLTHLEMIQANQLFTALRKRHGFLVQFLIATSHVSHDVVLQPVDNAT